MDNNQSYNTATIQVYKKRWLMLGLFLLFGIANSVQYPQYTVVTNLMASYYGVSYLDIAWSTLIFLVTFVIAAFPGIYVLEKVGIRKTLVFGSIVMSIGTWIKVISVKSTLYWLAFTGQTLVALFQILVFAIPPKLAALWYSDNEVATACGVGVAGPQFGIALGFLFTPLLIHQGTKEVIENGLYLSMISTALLCTFVAIAIFFFYEELPPKPPSVTQLLAVKSRILKRSTFRETISNIISNKSFVLLLIVFGANLGIFVVYSVYLNEVTLHYYPNASSMDVGLLGVSTILSLTIGVLLSGATLNRIRNYRSFTLLAFGLNLSGFLLFCYLFGDGLWLCKILSALFGFGIGCIFSLGYELGVELTYPEPEEISGGLLSCSFQLFGMILSCLYNLLFRSIGFTYANFLLVGAIVITDILLFFMDFDLRRQAVVEKTKYVELL